MSTPGLGEPTTRDLMIAGIVYACNKRPYFAPAFHAITLVETDQVDTACIDQYWRVYHNPNLIGKLPVPQIAGILTHEIGHNLRGHYKRAQEILDCDHEKWNHAGDLEINDDQEAEKEGGERLTPLPDWVLLPEKYNLKPDQFAEFYYRELPDPPKIEISIDMDGNGGDGDQKDGKQGSGGGVKVTVKFKPGGGKCGSGATGKREAFELPAPDTDAGKDSGGLTEAQVEMVRHRVADEIQRYIEQSSRNRGSVAEGWVRWAKEYLNPKVNFMQWVRATLRHGWAEATGKADYSFKRPSRRQEAYGRIIAPGMVQPKFRACFYIDTSGSMSDTQLGQCMAEVRGFFNQIHDAADVYGVTGDSQAYGVQRVTHAKQLELRGGGGTDVGELLKATQAMRPGIDLHVIMTDGYTPWPDKKPKGTVVLIQVGNGQPPNWPCHRVMVPVEAAE